MYYIENKVNYVINNITGTRFVK